MADASTRSVKSRDGLDVGLVLATSTGGVGRHVHSLAAGLVARGCRVRVCGPAATESMFGFRAAGATFFPVEIATGPRPLADSRAVVALRRALRAVDVVHAHGLRAGLLGGLAVPHTTPFVVTWHNLVLQTGAVGRLYGFLERSVARRADVTLGASDDLVERVRRLGGADVRLGEVAAPLLPEATRGAADVRVELGAAGSPLVLALGRLHVQKGFDVLVRAAALLDDRSPAPLVVIAGEGPEREPLTRMINDLRAPVRLLGRRDDVADLLAAADVAVLSSVWEARALGAQEALRAGVPLVATAVGGVPGLVGDAAVLVAPGDPRALAAAIARVLDDVHLRERLVAAGRSHAVAWADDTAVCDALLRLYLELRSR